MKLIISILIITISSRYCFGEETTATDIVLDMYDDCLSRLSFDCVRPKALNWWKSVYDHPEIRLTDDLKLIKTGEVDLKRERSVDGKIKIFDAIDDFLAIHSLKIQAPEILLSNEARSYIPESFLQGGLADGIQVPLVEANSVGEGRSIVKKVVIPFLLGLKFNTAVLVPLAFALIALKTWKALTLGLLSIVLSVAMVIFKFAKPKVVNYEVVHYPHHHVDHHIDHVHPPPHVHLEHVHSAPHVHVDHPPPGWEPHGWARHFDGQDRAYAGQLQMPEEQQTIY